MSFRSSLDNSKSNTWKFSFSLSSFDDLGMTTVFLWMPQRRAIWAVVFLYFSARPWNQRKWYNLLKLIYSETVFSYTIAGSYGSLLISLCSETSIDHSLWKLGHPNMKLYQTIQYLLHHLLMECVQWHKSHASDKTWRETHAGSMDGFQSDLQQVLSWNMLSNLLSDRYHSCCK